MEIKRDKLGTMFCKIRRVKERDGWIDRRQIDKKSNRVEIGLIKLSKNAKG